MQVKKGLYRHFKGGKCRVIGVAKHSETLEELVVYEHPDENGKMELWVRPKEMFFEKVEKGGKKVPRFKYIGREAKS
jgi:hypothetical protein